MIKHISSYKIFVFLVIDHYTLVLKTHIFLKDSKQ